MSGPKVRFNKEDIILKSKEYIDMNGIKMVSIRNLAKYIGCSTQPIFRHYVNGDELMADVYQSIEQSYEHFIEQVSNTIDIPFLGMGLGYIQFAKEHPNLFYALFMDTYYQKDSLLDFFKNDESTMIVDEMSNQIGLSQERCRLLLRDIWLLTHGIATMVYTKQVNYQDEEIREILFHGFYGFISILKSKENSHD